MHSLRSFSSFIITAVLATAQVPASPLGDHDKPVTLETLVVTGNPDARSTFNLAQGASVLTGLKLHLDLKATLGETLAATPGVNSTYYGPGASRPIIRGLGGDRVRMLDNGIGSLDASNVSPDHNVSIEPLLVDRIEVLRGPATLLYGNSAVGGVVNVIDNRIPKNPPYHFLSGQIETRYGSAARERTGIAALTIGNENLAVQINGLRTTTNDVSIPGFADPSNPVNRGTLTNSAVSTKSGSVGATTFWPGGNAGLAVSEYNTIYGVPAGEPINIDMKQQRADLRTEITEPFPRFKSLKFRFGIANYHHAEVDTTTGLANTIFHNKAYEGRLEFIQRESGNLSGTVGAQFTRSDFSAVGEEVVTPSSVTSTQALFVLESLKFNSKFTLQFGGRLERQNIKLGPVDQTLPAFPGYAAASAEQRSDHAASLSTGAVIYPAKDWSIGLSAAWSQRNPTAQELFSHGPHGGTGSYEIGTSSLGKEKSLGLDLNLRKRAGLVEGSMGVFSNRFKNYIFEQVDTHTYFDEVSGSFRSYPVPPGTAFLPIHQFVSRDAIFYGAEAELSLHLLDTESARLHLDLKADTVHAQQTTDDQPLPRIPPLRTGVALNYETGPWDFGLNLRHTFDQNRVAPKENPTKGYTLFGANVAYHWANSRTEWKLFIHGTNLTNQDARISTSFLKEISPLPGRSVDLGLRVSF